MGLEVIILGTALHEACKSADERSKGYHKLWASTE